MLTFTTPSFEGTAKIVYAYLTMSLMMLTYTAINIPYSALLGVLTPDSKDRTSVSSYRFVMALLPVFVIVNTAIPMVEYFGGGDSNSAARLADDDDHLRRSSPCCCSGPPSR